MEASCTMNAGNAGKKDNCDSNCPVREEENGDEDDVQWMGDERGMT